MKRALFFILLLVLGAAVAGLRMGWIQAPFALPPFLQKQDKAGQDKAGQDKAESGGGGRRGMRDGATPVSVASVARENVPVTLDVIGTAQALNTVVVRPQVDGRLIQIAFQEGQEVNAGDVIARIDPAIYQAQYDQAAARKSQDEALLANARRDLERYVRLAADNTGSKQQADTQRAAVAQLEAQVRADQAAIDTARTTLDYTEIRAPLSGRLGLRQVDQGNILRAGETAGIVTITQIKPIAVILTLAQQFIGEVNQAIAKGPVETDALAPDNATVIERGKVAVIDNQIDATTGAVKMKAIFANADAQLWPGRFVNARLFVNRLDNVLTIPTSAVQRGPDGAYVYVVKDDDTVAQTPVTVTMQTEYKAVIATGLSEGQRVATTSFSRLTNGAKVRVGAPSNGSPNAPPSGASSGAPNAPPPNSADEPADGAKTAPAQGRRKGERKPPAQPAPPGPPQ